MKRIGNILISLLLVVMMVYLGGGVAVARCLHSDVTTSLEATSKSCMCGGDDSAGHQRTCCPVEKSYPSCMSIGVEKLNPTLSGHAFAFDFSAMQIALFVSSGLFAINTLIGAVDGDCPEVVRKIPLPPRLYQSLFCTYLF